MFPSLDDKYLSGKKNIQRRFSPEQDVRLKSNFRRNGRKYLFCVSAEIMIPFPTVCRFAEIVGITLPTIWICSFVGEHAKTISEDIVRAQAIWDRFLFSNRINNVDERKHSNAFWTRMYHILRMSTSWQIINGCGWLMRSKRSNQLSSDLIIIIMYRDFHIRTNPTSWEKE